MDWLLAGLGLVILLLAGDSLVKGAVNLSLRLGIPPVIVGLTVVAFGTSAPELLVSIKAVLDNAPGIAIGNVVGSNIANILLVLGLPALFKGLATGAHDARRDYTLMLGASAAFTALCFTAPLTPWHGLVLLAGLTAILLDQYRMAQAHRRTVAANNSFAASNTAADGGELEDLDGLDPEMPTWQVTVYLVLGLAGLPLGADLLVDSGVSIARTFGISETVIGLTLVAVGTSLPELATTLMAALRGNTDVALGNVLGSNIFNLLAIIGIASLIGDIPVDPEFLRLDLWVMLGASLLLAPIVFCRRDISRIAGGGLLAAYLVYLGVLLA